MIRLEQALRAWGTDGFATALERELRLNAEELPLRQELRGGNYVADAPLTAMLHGAEARGDILLVRAGIFYQGVIGGCSCADDPAPASETAEYCAVRIEIDRTTGQATVMPAEEG